MHFLIDKKLKIIFGWSAKCGCSHIKKIFWYLQNNNEDNVIHMERDYKSLPKYIKKYTIILIIRNPYERIVSGFLDKYRENGEFRKLWKNDIITFSTFIDELLKNDFKIIDKHHFTPQTTESFDKDLILKSKCLKLFDIKNIDYDYIEKLYNKKIPKILLDFKGGHEKISYNKLFESSVYDLDMKIYFSYDVPVDYFYNQDIKNKVYHFYKNDFIFFKEYNFDYIISKI
jgi:hypothetical protein